MAGKKENLKSLLSNTRTRVIIIFTALILLIAVAIGFIKLRTTTNEERARLASMPSIRSIPGALNPTMQYEKLQQMQNIQQATAAMKAGGSAIPTIIRTQAIGPGGQPIGVPTAAGTAGAPGVGFTTLAREVEAGEKRSLWLQTLQKASCSKASVTQVVTEGAKLADLKAVCSCTQLKDNGIQLKDLQQVCSCKELRAAGFNARQLKDIGFSARRLRLCDFNACEMRSAGFTALQMKDAGFSDGELKGAGFPENEIAQASGLPSGISEVDVRKADCQIDALKRLYAQGVSASAIRRISGCGAAQLKAAGYSAADLKNAGFTAADLKNAGFSAAQLRQAGFSARDLLNAGFTRDDLANVGFTPGQIAAADSELPPGISLADIKSGGSEIGTLRKQRLAAVSAKMLRQGVGASAYALKQAGFTDNELANAGFTPAEINAVRPVDDNTIRAADCDPNKLKAFYPTSALASRIRALNNCTAAQLKAAGYDAKQLVAAGFSPQELLSAGFAPEEVSAGLSSTDAVIRAADCDPAKLKSLYNQEVPARRIRELNGCSAQVLKNAGYDPKALSDAGFTPQELLAAGFTPAQLTQAGVGAAAAIAAGRTADCSIAALQAARAVGASAATIRQTLGCNPAAMKAAGYSAKELRDAGFTAAELKNAGFNINDLKNAGFSVKELADAGFSATDLKNAGFTASQLKDAGFSAADLKNAGFTANQLKTAGFGAKELRDAGFSAADLKNAGFSANELKEAGLNSTDLKNAGFTASQLKAAGYSAKDLADAGFNGTQLANAGFSNNEIEAAGATVPGVEVLPPGGVPSTVARMPGVVAAPTPGAAVTAAQATTNAEQLKKILHRQQAQLAEQKYQQKIQQRMTQMLNSANEALQNWQKVATQVYVQGVEPQRQGVGVQQAGGAMGAAPGAMGAPGTTGAPPLPSGQLRRPGEEAILGAGGRGKAAIIKTGDVFFGVLDTTVNSDEPSPILATIVSGRFKGARLIGSFNLPSNGDKVVISFNTMSIPGAAKTTPISAFAIDANTARTALASHANHHYLLRYGSLFAAAFLQGIGYAFASANTIVAVGPGGIVQSNFNRSMLDNAIIGLTAVGNAWGQVAMQQFNIPPTVEVCAGTGIGVLFTQDVTDL
jgi:intracellular multiplication protein IcmE